ncbi:MAG: phosphate ABC transporter substrate-binding protein PstS, partial [Candidatus Dormibacteria bacterium]
DLGGVAISYNLPGVATGLHLDAPTLAEIFDGTITKWNDPRLAQATGNNSLPNLPIVAVHRADSSGPGYDFDQYLITNSPQWVSDVHTSTASKTWPLATVGVGEQLNAGVATYISQTSGAIGYVEYSYAFQNQFTNAALKNPAGDYVAPSEAGITAAGATTTDISATNFSIVDEPGATTYPLANFSWALVYQKQTDQAKGQALAALLGYLVTSAQSEAATLGYAPMPSPEVKLTQNGIAQLLGPTGKALTSPTTT